jgi:hypothetical protein
VRNHLQFYAILGQILAKSWARIDLEFRNLDLEIVQKQAIHYKGERRPITLELQEREEHLRAARNYGEEAEEKDREEGEGREPREEA